MAETYRFFSNPENRAGVAGVVAEAAVFTVLPSMARPAAIAYRMWNLFHPSRQAPIQNPRPMPQKASNSPQAAGLECYLQAIQSSDPLLLSPVGTMPFGRCLSH
ncbi:MAG TPA: hypothetical protein VFW62_06825 [bacterium]|nr:hypothetical protein [bacterium]